MTSPVNSPEIAPSGDPNYRCGTLQYTKATLFGLFGWMIMGNLCFGLFEGNGGAGSIPFFLQENFRVSNLTVNLLFNFIPMIIGTFMTPIISFKSDRTRTRLGRRIPYILYTAPFLVLFAVALGFSDDIISRCKVLFPEGSRLAPLTAALIAIGFLTIGWSFFNEFVGTVYYYLLPDVMPNHFLGRFSGISSVAGTLLNIAMNTFVMPHQLTHIKAIHVGVAVLYFIGFGLLCWRVKEGQYPPVQDVSEKSSFGQQARLYFKQCFHHPIYILFYVTTAVGILSKGMNVPTVSTLGIFGLHLGQHKAEIAAGPIAGDTVSGAQNVPALVAMTRDGKTLLSAGQNNGLILWDIADPKKPALKKTLNPKIGPLTSVAVSPGGWLAAVGSQNGNVEIWNLASGLREKALTGHSAAIRSVAFSDDGARLVSAGLDGAVRVWDVRSGEVQRVLTGHPGGAYCAAFSSDGRRIVSGGADKNIIVWDATTGAMVKTLAGSPGPVYAVCFMPALERAPARALSPDGKVDAAVHTVTGFVRNVFSNESMYDPSASGQCRVKTEDGWVVSGGRDGATDGEYSGLRIWDVDKGRLLPEVEALKEKALAGHKKAITCVAFKPDLNVILSGSADASLRVWRPCEAFSALAQDQAYKTFSGYTHAVTGLSCQENGVLLVNASANNTVHVWDIDQGVSLEKASRYGANFFMILGLIIAIPLGILVDRWNPIKIVLWSSLCWVPIHLLNYFFYRDYLSGMLINLLTLPLGIGGMAGIPMMVKLFPRTKFGQFSSANAMVRQAVSAVAGVIGAMAMDAWTHGALMTDNYRYGFLFKTAICLVSFCCLLGVYFQWKKLGGENYQAPEA